MKKIIALLISILLLTSIQSFAVKPYEKEFTDLKNPLIITKNNPHVVIKLKSNPSTGFSWAIGNYDKKLLTLKGNKYYRATNMLVGAPGFEIWSFKATPNFKPNQTTTITMQYRRPWTKEGATNTDIQVQMK